MMFSYSSPDRLRWGGGSLGSNPGRQSKTRGWGFQRVCERQDGRGSGHRMNRALHWRYADAITGGGRWLCCGSQVAGESAVCGCENGGRKRMEASVSFW